MQRLGEWLFTTAASYAKISVLGPIDGDRLFEQAVSFFIIPGVPTPTQPPR
jgi:hypothetical protein